jgi:hypothetical protein
VPAHADETVLPLPTPLVAARHARSTVLLGSMAVVREAGRFDEYSARLPAEHREMLLGAIAGSWIPIDAALAHYETCEALNLPVDQQVQNGKAVFDKTRGTLLGTMLRMARESGISPWNVIPYFQRFWERGYDGGGLTVVRLGPKEARMDIVAFRLCDCRYYRNAVRGLTVGVLELFCTKAYVTERPGSRQASSMSMRMQWA